MEKAEDMIARRGESLCNDSLLVFPIYSFTQNLENINDSLYEDYSFLNGLSHSISYPDDIFVGDLDGNLICVFANSKDREGELTTYTIQSSWGDNDEQKRMLVKMLRDGVFDYAFITDVPLNVEQGIEKGIHHCLRNHVYFLIKNEEIYVLFENNQILTMKEFVELHGASYPYKSFN
ncbi:MAG: hypothetical protein MJZ94_04805 [Bacteroidales bacterium]|nr:hypothetical protein [Bacteroidales bacterium]